MNRILKENKGITLIALVITIIILLILAIVTINILINEGIIGHAETAVNAYDERQAREQVMLCYNEWKMGRVSGETTSLYDHFVAKYGADNVTDNGDGSINVKVTTNLATYTYLLKENGEITLINTEKSNGGGSTTPGQQEQQEEQASATFYAFLYDTDSDGKGDELVFSKTSTPDASKTVIKDYGDKFNNISGYASDLKTVTIQDKIAPTTMYYWFNGASNLTTINNIEKIDASNVTSMESAFRGCSSLETLDLTSFKTPKLTNTAFAFNECSKVKEIKLSENFDTSNVTNMRYMFCSCSELTTVDVSHFNTAKVTSMRSMFNGDHELGNIDVSGWNTSNVTDMAFMFNCCEHFTELNITNFDTSKVTDISVMFASCWRLQHIDIRNFDTSNVTNMEALFWYCSSLQDFQADPAKFKTNKVTNMALMFGRCISMKELDLSFFDTSNVTNMGKPTVNFVWWRDGTMMYHQGMFYHCENLERLNLSSFNTSKVTDFREMFKESTKLTEIKVGDGWVINDGAQTDEMFTDCGTDTVTKTN